MRTKLFHLARFQVLSAALTNGTSQLIDEAYVFAWLNWVFPYGNWTGVGLHFQFEEEFAVRSSQMEFWSASLDRFVHDDAVPTYIELREALGISQNVQDERNFIDGLRYMFLGGRREEHIFRRLGTPGGFSREEERITQPFSRWKDVNLC
jgi:hypothetical protein